MVFLVIGLFIGCILGYVLRRVSSKGTHIGTLVIDHSEPDSPPDIYVALDVPVEEIEKLNYVTFKTRKQHSL